MNIAEQPNEALSSGRFVALEAQMHLRRTYVESDKVMKKKKTGKHGGEGGTLKAMESLVNATDLAPR